MLYVYLEPVAQRSDDLQKMFEIIKKVQVENANVLSGLYKSTAFLWYTRPSNNSPCNNLLYD